MNRNYVFLLGAALVPFSALGQEAEKLFNGKDLTGWDGDPRLWSVVDGILVGESNATDKKVSPNTFLIWKGGEIGDFDFKMTARVTGNNSGVQYRSKVLDPKKWSVGGYQMDMHPKQEYLGMLYEERGRGIQCLRGERVELTADGKKTVTGKLPVAEVKLEEWNEYSISARGNVVKHFVNGKQATEIVDNNPEKRSLKGLLALQLHAGPAMKLEVKEVVLRKVKAAAPAPAKKPAAKKPAAKKAAATVKRAVPSWIWSAPGERPNGEKVYFRKSFELGENDKAATVTMAADNYFEVWLNGKVVGKGDDWSAGQVFEVRKDMQKGKNVIAVLGRNDGGVAGLAGLVEVTFADGKKLQVVSDGSWKCSPTEATGWQQPGFDDSKWKSVAVLGKMGMAPWGNSFGGAVATGVPGEPQAPQDATGQFKVAKGFKLEKLYTTPKSQGSWVSMAVRPDGRLVVCDQYGGMYGVKLPAIGDPEAVTEVTPLNLPIGGAHGMLWHRNALYVAVNEKGQGGKKNGVYKVTDKDGDGELDTIVTLKEISGGGEHGLHSLVPSPDGEWIYFIAGNHTRPPEMDHYWMAKNWDEDHLLPRNPDGNGHASGTMAPGGWIARFKPDNSRWEMVANGFRNPFDMAFNQHGDLFAYDADMEWDFGMPWYRPTRICHVVPGAEFGWRNGTGKWPTYYEDSLPPVVDIGPGSPTGALSGIGGKVPAKYQKALYFFDWTFATIHCVHPVQEGASYTGIKEEFVAGPGLPLTDAQWGKDGAMYFMTGGRRTAGALWRVTYTGSESTAPISTDTAGSPLPELVEELAKASMPAVVKTMGSEDRHERFLARLEAERRPISALLGAMGGASPWQRINAALAVARQGSKTEREVAMKGLGVLKWDELGKAHKLGVLRAYGLLFSRLGAPSEAEWKVVIKQIDADYPNKDDELNRELCRMLCYLQAPEVVGRTLKLMAARKDTVWPDWAELATRNSGYGRSVLNMLRNTPPAQDIHYAFCVRNVKGPWTTGQRRQIMEWYAAVNAKSGGNSYKNFLKRMKDDMLKNATEEERKLIAGWKLQQPKNPFEGLPTPKGPGRNWSVAEVVTVGQDLSGANLENGKQMFKATLCFACHRVGGEGGSAGPDLSAVGGRFTVESIAEALLEPNKVISDQYQFHVISKKDGSSVWGRVMDEAGGKVTVAVNAFDFSETEDVAQSEIKNIEPSPVSPMPAGLINSLNADELRDLLGFLLQK